MARPGHGTCPTVQYRAKDRVTVPGPSRAGPSTAHLPPIGRRVGALVGVGLRWRERRWQIFLLGGRGGVELCGR